MIKDTSNKFCSILFDVLQQKGLQHLVCSPGSRNAPLLIAASAREDLKKHFVVDERSAAFMALGLSLVRNQPAGLICTSGTALLNYAPAVAEAYYQGVPLIVISADRPLQWIDQDDSQTIRQDSALNNFVKGSYNIPVFEDDNPELLWYVNRIANEAFVTATSGKPGPVHINIHLSEPLNGSVQLKKVEQRIIDTLTGDILANKETIKELAKKLSESKVMLVAGFMPPDSALQKAIADFSRLPNVVVMAETISNLHLNEDDYSIDSVLTSLTDERLDVLCPDIVLSLGGSLISRKLKEYLRKHSDRINSWNIGLTNFLADPFMSLRLKLEVDPVRFFRNINSALRKYTHKGTDSYKKEWETVRAKAAEIKNKYIETCEWSELKAFDVVLNQIPRNYNLFLSNGTPIRYAQIIDYQLPHASYCNRGVSGIDGSTSTAIGGCMAYKGGTLLITGDLSFIYDISAMNISETPASFKVIVIDNQGGGIFRFIPSTSGLPQREEYFCQKPFLPVAKLAEAYNWHYLECDNEESLKESLKNLWKSPGKTILKISCNGEKSAEILKNYMKLKI